jgi:hypothetical protein
MITNGQKLRSFERNFIRRTKADFRTNVALVEAMFREAVTLGVFPPKDSLAGIEVDIRIARAINYVSTAP